MRAVCSGTRGRGCCGWSDMAKPPEITAPTPLSTFRLTHSPTVSDPFWDSCGGANGPQDEGAQRKGRGQIGQSHLGTCPCGLAGVRDVTPDMLIGPDGVPGIRATKAQDAKTDHASDAVAIPNIRLRVSDA